MKVPTKILPTQINVTIVPNTAFKRFYRRIPFIHLIGDFPCEGTFVEKEKEICYTPREFSSGKTSGFHASCERA
jgi:hypothetical protein